MKNARNFSFKGDMHIISGMIFILSLDTESYLKG